MTLLGYDIGTSSVKASLVDAQTGNIVATAQYPDNEAPISAPQPGWAEQDPQMWWDELRQATGRLAQKVSLADVSAIGISYQMHGLVCVDRQLKVLRPSIIWCDSRASKYGGSKYGNFTAAKLAWVKAEEPDVYNNIYKVMLPGDYIAMRLSGGEPCTTPSGLSEGLFWDLEHDCLDHETMQHFGFPESLIPEVRPTFSVQCRVCPEMAIELGIPEGTPISYRAGDQPNNALSLNVVRPGEVAATAGTSGVVYGVSETYQPDALSRVNVFQHMPLEQDGQAPTASGLPSSKGILLCINGTGIMNAWMKRTVAPEGIGYAEMNELAESAPIGSDGLSVIPFGNGAERILQNCNVGASVVGIDLNVHKKAHMLRAAQEGIVFSMAYGMEIMASMGMQTGTIKAGHANMFLSPLFCRTLASVTGATIELYNTDGAVGAARGAGIGAGIYKSYDEAFSTLTLLGTIEPDTANKEAYLAAYNLWKKRLQTLVK